MPTCIYCKTTTTGQEGRAHAIPEALERKLGTDLFSTRSSMLAEFDEALNKFKQIHLELTRCLASNTSVKFFVYMPAAELANDIIGLSCVFREVYLSATNFYRESETTKPPLILEIRYVGAISDASTEVGIKLKVMYKALFYSLRAYQDALYKVILEIKGQESGKYASMIRAIDESARKFKLGNPVGELLNDACPEYADCFLDLRKKRNDIKQGINLSIHGPAEDVGIGFNTFKTLYLKNNQMVSKDDDYDEKVYGIGFSFANDRVLRLGDVTKYLTMSRRIAEVALDQTKRKCNEQ